MLKVFIVIIFVYPNVAEPDVFKKEVESVEKCVEHVQLAMKYTPADFGAIGLAAGCEIQDESKPS